MYILFVCFQSVIFLYSIVFNNFIHEYNKPILRCRGDPSGRPSSLLLYRATTRVAPTPQDVFPHYQKMLLNECDIRNEDDFIGLIFIALVKSKKAFKGCFSFRFNNPLSRYAWKKSGLSLTAFE